MSIDKHCYNREVSSDEAILHCVGKEILSGLADFFDASRGSLIEKRTAENRLYAVEITVRGDNPFRQSNMVDKYLQMKGMYASKKTMSENILTVEIRKNNLD